MACKSAFLNLSNFLRGLSNRFEISVATAKANRSNIQISKTREITIGPGQILNVPLEISAISKPTHSDDGMYSPVDAECPVNP